ncbi:MAG: DUF2769 domain-containing protein [Firmicutes bacterium]|nr:DUF2769 domain-containing protein [Bacillota bacterium]
MGAMPKVDFSVDNLNKCLCPSCPVEGSSDCANERMEKEQVPKDTSQISNPKLLVRLYCSIGATDCGGFDGLLPCVCPSCPVWDGCELTSRYYCLRGDADEVDMV